ncbi:hypothetical protein AB0O76_30775 [Streptomyces sp. NPDC086554]|uniref:hypothetical protein n=1 Tax=Streptomyces sp. NPDC086554 TaxID=3154864 RepID=UPI0034251127
MTRFVTGCSHLTTWGEQIRDDNARLNCKVSDTAKDGEARENPDGSYGAIRFQVCRTRPLWDSCSTEAVLNL